MEYAEVYAPLTFGITYDVLRGKTSFGVGGAVGWALHEADLPEGKTSREVFGISDVGGRRIGNAYVLEAWLRRELSARISAVLRLQQHSPSLDLSAALRQSPAALVLGITRR